MELVFALLITLIGSQSFAPNTEVNNGGDVAIEYEHYAHTQIVK